jgi:peptidoglycan/xylan/chitin deacetylase (PgdA/CDA1 family)
MDRIMAHFAKTVSQFDGSATFPITTVALARSKGVVEKYQAHNIEFAVHGYYHIDHTRLSLDKQLAQLANARRLFDERGVTCSGFRSPYLRWSADTIAALSQAAFLYDGSQALAWDVVDGVETAAYRRVLDFYGALSATHYPALPHWDNGLVRIPYCLPDDEALIDRLQLTTAESMNKLWLAILDRTYDLGELFTLGLHPERIRLCETPLVETLRAARALSPGVWIARLDEIARWWKARTEASVTVLATREVGGTSAAGWDSPAAATGDSREVQELYLDVDGPDGVTILARGVEVLSPARSWDGVYQRVEGAEIWLRAARRPFIGVSPSSSPYLTSFLRQQGYIVEQTASSQTHTIYLDRPQFDYADERRLLAQIEQSDAPLVRLGRWPYGTRSALCITGDIDALTIWDYGLRFLGN